MALRDALFRRSPDKTRTKDTPARAPQPKTAKTTKATKTAKTAKTTKTAKAKPTAKPAARSTAKPAVKRIAKPAVKPAARRAAKPAAKPLPKAIARPGKASAGTGAGFARRWRRPTAGAARKRSPEPAVAAGRTADRAADRTPATKAPLLQRRSAAALLARAAVLAVAFVAMVAFAVALAKVTLVPSPSSDALVHTNLRPGASIRAYLDQPNVRDTVKQIGGNILLGVPFGFLLPALFPRARGLLRVACFTALVMLLVETAQGAIVEGRAFDIDDVILNTAGALIGYLLIGRRLGRALHPRRVHWWHRLGYGTSPESER